MVEWSGWDGLWGLGLWPHRYPHHKVFQCCIQQQNDQKLLQYLQQTDIKCHINSHWPSILIRWWLSNVAKSVLLIVHVSCAFFGELSTDIIFLLFLSVMPFQKLNWPFLGVGTHVSQPLGHMCPNPPSSSSAACVPTPLMTNLLWIKWALNKP